METDVRLTKDGILMVCHDQKLGRLTSDDRKIRDVDYKDLPCFKQEIAVEFSPMTDDKFDFYQLKSSDHKMYHTLEEIFQKIEKSIPMTIDVKDNCEEALKAVLDLVRKYDRFTTTMIGDTTGKMQTLCKKLEPKACCHIG